MPAGCLVRLRHSVAPAPPGAAQRCWGEVTDAATVSLESVDGAVKGRGQSSPRVNAEAQRGREAQRGTGVSVETPLAQDSGSERLGE